jgi:hypothetical protein
LISNLKKTNTMFWDKNKNRSSLVNLKTRKISQEMIKSEQKSIVSQLNNLDFKEHYGIKQIPFKTHFRSKTN